jgi:hypothetical protein
MPLNRSLEDGAASRAPLTLPVVTFATATTWSAPQRKLLPAVLGIEPYRTSGIDLVRIVVNYARSHQRSFSQVTAQPEGNHHPFIAPFGIFPALDGAVSIAAPSDEFFRALCTSLDARSRHSLKANGRTVTD